MRIQPRKAHTLAALSSLLLEGAAECLRQAFSTTWYGLPLRCMPHGGVWWRVVACGDGLCFPQNFYTLAGGETDGGPLQLAEHSSVKMGDMVTSLAVSPKVCGMCDARFLCLDLTIPRTPGQHASRRVWFLAFMLSVPLQFQRQGQVQDVSCLVRVAACSMVTTCLSGEQHHRSVHLPNRLQGRGLLAKRGCV